MGANANSPWHRIAVSPPSVSASVVFASVVISFTMMAVTSIPFPVSTPAAVRSCTRIPIVWISIPISVSLPIPITVMMSVPISFATVPGAVALALASGVFFGFCFRGLRVCFHRLIPLRIRFVMRRRYWFRLFGPPRPFFFRRYFFRGTRLFDSRLLIPFTFLLLSRVIFSRMITFRLLLFRFHIFNCWQFLA